MTRTCPQAIIDAGYTCGCPIRIDPAHLVMNYHPQREVLSLWQPLSDFGLFGNGIESIIEVVLQLFSGISDVKKISSQYGFLTTVSILKYNKNINTQGINLTFFMI